MPDTTEANLYERLELKAKNGLPLLAVYPYNDSFRELRRTNYYSLLLLSKGSGLVQANFDQYPFTAGALMAFCPFQPFALDPVEETAGMVMEFHPDFYCIYMHQKEVACNGVLFNNIYDPPITNLTESDVMVFTGLLLQMQKELSNSALAQYELLVSYLKIFLINASRIKSVQQDTSAEIPNLQEKHIVQDLKDVIELNYRSVHSPTEYADMLRVPLKTLSRVAKKYFNKTLSKLIAERIVTEAKRELYLTDKTVKEIAYELGYADEYYFSRFFKTNSTVSPQVFRETVGFAKMKGKSLLI
jgi:AraC-like DNA-binding protein